MENLHIGQDGRRFIIFSAPGKRDPTDTKITDLLIECNRLAKADEPFDQVFDKVATRYRDIGQGLHCVAMDTWLDQLHEGIQTQESEAWNLSRGEWMLTRALADAYGAAFVDAAKLIRLRKNGQISNLTYRLIQHQLTGDSVFFIPGFYGVDGNGNIQVFARGGSDITGAIIAKGVGARLYENWKDVNGVLVADPRIVGNPKSISEMTYTEMRELSYRGADVLQRDAVLPAIEADIPIQIRSAFEPDLPGTMIVSQREIARDESVIGIAGKGGFISFTIKKPGIHEQVGVGRRVLSIFERLKIPFDHSMTAQDAMSIIVSKESLGEKEESLRQEFQKNIQPDSVDVIRNLGLICVVGEGIKNHTALVHAALFQTLDGLGIGIRAQGYTTDGVDIVVGVDEEHIAPAIRGLYNRFTK